MDKRRIPSGLNVLAGLWLIVAPFALGYAFYEAAMWNSVIVGVLVAALAASRTFGHVGAWASWLNVILGAWLVVSPTLFQFGAFGISPTNEIVMGLIVAALAVLSAFMLPHNEANATWTERDVVFHGTEPTQEELQRDGGIRHRDD